MKYNYKCVVTKNDKRYYKNVSGKWKRISNKIGEKTEKGKKKYRVNEGASSSGGQSSFLTENEMLDPVYKNLPPKYLELLRTSSKKIKDFDENWKIKRDLKDEFEISKFQKLPLEERNKLLIKTSQRGPIRQLRQLLRTGADINFKGGDYNESPLITASTYGETEIVNELLKSKDINIDRDGLDALIVSIMEGNVEAVRLLLKAGVKISEEDIPEFFNNEEIIKEIIDEYI